MCRGGWGQTISLLFQSLRPLSDSNDEHPAPPLPVIVYSEKRDTSLFDSTTHSIQHEEDNSHLTSMSHECLYLVKKRGLSDDGWMDLSVFI